MTRLANERRPVRGAGQSRAAVSFHLRVRLRTHPPAVRSATLAQNCLSNVICPARGKKRDDAWLSRTSIAEPSFSVPLILVARARARAIRGVSSRGARFLFLIF